MKVLLASASPRRKELLNEVFCDFKVETYPANEDFLGDTPQATVKEIAFRKLDAVPQKERFDVIISSDTLVYKDGKYYGKPKDRNQAIEMLLELEGRTHVVCSGVALYVNGNVEVFAESTLVTFNSMSREQIEEYSDNHYCLDKAGAYAIQDGVVVKEIVGSYSNVVGLPVEKLKEILKEKKII